MPIYYTCNSCGKIIFVTTIADCCFTTLYKEKCPNCLKPISLQPKPYNYITKPKALLLSRFVAQLESDLNNGLSIFICNESDLNRIRKNLKYNVGRKPNILNDKNMIMEVTQHI